MAQNINLYQDVLIDRPEPLPPRQIGMALLALLFLMIGLSGFSLWQLQQQRSQLQALLQEEQSREAVVSELERQYPERQKSMQLEQEIHRLEQQLAGEKDLLGYFAGRDAGGNQAIVATLEGLAQHVREGIWLRRIALDASGEKVELAGTALHPDEVPSYLEYLGDQGIFSGRVFASLKLARLKQNQGPAGAVDFSLQSQAEKN